MTEKCERTWRCLPHGLFWRVFLTIGVAVLISAVMSFGLFYMSASRNLERVFAQDYTGLTSQVREALDSDSLIELQSSFKIEKHAMLVVLEGKQALGTRPPPWLMDKGKPLLPDGKTHTYVVPSTVKEAEELVMAAYESSGVGGYSGVEKL